MWQLAKGRHQSRTENQWFDDKFCWTRKERSRVEYSTNDLDGIGVMAADTVELLPIFAAEVRLVSYDEWKEMSNEEVKALAITEIQEG